VYILIRQKKGSSLIERFKREVLGSQCFDRLRKEIGANFDQFILDKIKPIEGDMLKENIGLSAQDLADICENVHVPSHLALRS
jgi:thioester reductase-like protein